MLAEENKTVVRRMTEEVLCGGNLDLMDELVATDFVNHNLLATGEESQSIGVNSYRQEAIGFRSVFPDIAVTIIRDYALDKRLNLCYSLVDEADLESFP